MAFPKGRSHSPETRAKMSASHTGLTATPETRAKLSVARKARPLKEVVGYAQAHRRVYSARGRPSPCSVCGTTAGKLEWANRTGNYLDVQDYDALCTRHHAISDGRVSNLTEVTT